MSNTRREVGNRFFSGAEGGAVNSRAVGEQSVTEFQNVLEDINQQLFADTLPDPTKSNEKPDYRRNLNTGAITAGLEQFDELAIDGKITKSALESEVNRTFEISR